jgi:hypothetical protein
MNRIFAVLCLAFVAAPAQAHHSGAMFDGGKTATLDGTVVKFEWVNPHASIEVLTMDAAGQQAHWTVECSAVNIIARKGWRKETLHPGDKVSIIVHPMRDGTLGGQLMQIVLTDGTKLTDHDY